MQLKLMNKAVLLYLAVSVTDFRRLPCGTHTRYTAECSFRSLYSRLVRACAIYLSNLFDLRALMALSRLRNEMRGGGDTLAITHTKKYINYNVSML